MFATVIAMFSLSVVALIAGIVLCIVYSGEHQRRMGPDVGEEMVDTMMRDAIEDENMVTKTAFRGEAVAVGGNAEFSFADIKGMVRAGRWKQAFPILLAFAGALGIFVWGSVGAFFYLNKFVGILFAAVTLYCVVQTARAFRRA